MSRYLYWCMLPVVVLILSAPGCTPGDGGGGPSNSCRAHSDCKSGQICNPGSLQCIQDVSVGRNEFAGTFEFILAPDGAGQSQNMYAKANMEGVVYEINQMTVFGGDETKIQFDFRSMQDDTSWIALLITLPMEVLTVGSHIPLSDGLDPADGYVGDGILALHYPGGEGPEDDDYTLVAQVESGTFFFSALEVEVGGMVSGEFRGTLMPPSYMNAMGWMSTCPAGELLDPVSLTCIAAFSGYNFAAGLDTLYNSAESGGNIISSYSVDVENQMYRMGPAWSFDTGGNVVIQGVWSTDPGGLYRMLQITTPHANCASGANLDIGAQATVAVFAGEELPNGDIDFSEVLATVSSGRVKIRHFRDEPSGRLFASVGGTASGGGTGIGEGQDCRVSDDQCRDPLVCLPMTSADAGWCFPTCSGDPDCVSPRTCENTGFFGGQRYDVCVQILGLFVKGCDGRQLKWCASGNPCVVHQEQPRDSICLQTCDPSGGTGCSNGQECWELADPTQGVCYWALGRRDECGTDRMQDGYLCAHADICLTISSDSIVRASCLGKCDLPSGIGCTGQETCLATTNPSLGACWGLLNRGSACNRNTYLNGYICRDTDICVGDAVTAYCREDCTASRVCPAGFTCTQLTTGSYACAP